MKNYLVFYGYSYSPMGGMDDFIGDYSKKAQAIDALKKHHKTKNKSDKNWDDHWGNVYSLKDRKYVFYSHIDLIENTK